MQCPNRFAHVEEDKAELAGFVGDGEQKGATAGAQHHGVAVFAAHNHFLYGAVDVPGFDRSNVDGFAVRAADLAGTRADAPCRLRLNTEVLTPGKVPAQPVEPGTATVIATGGMIPRGADAVVMVENTEPVPMDGMPGIEVRQAVPPGAAISVAGSDIGAGETVLRAGTQLGSREIAVLAAIGAGSVSVFRRPRIAILSTGDELVAPGTAIARGQIYDSNGPMLAAAVEELGCEAIALGIVADERAAMEAIVDRAVAEADAVLLSGGTSKGAGDLAFHAIARFTDPGIVVHGVALKPGKPLCLAVTGGKPVAILPGFPTSATFTFQEFVAPVLRILAGLPPLKRQSLTASLAVRQISEFGRTNYTLVSLAEKPEGGFAAYPIGKGSGAVTAFAMADGFFAIPADMEGMAAGTRVEITCIGSQRDPAGLTIIGSHCLGLDYLVGRLVREGIAAKVLAVGSTGGLSAARRGECDIAGIHLMDPQTGVYNRPFMDETLRLIPGYNRLQGIVFRAEDARFAGRSAEAALAAALEPGCLMINRNAGSGTRILIDLLLAGRKPEGYSHQTKSHNAVAAAVLQGRADWGIAIETVAQRYGLGFIPLQPERYDFVIPAATAERETVKRFITLLEQADVQADLKAMGFTQE